MEREILFRAKLKDWKINPEHNRWVEGFYLKRKETTYCFTEDYEKYPVKTLHFIAEECMTDWGCRMISGCMKSTQKLSVKLMDGAIDIKQEYLKMILLKLYLHQSIPISI